MRLLWMLMTLFLLAAPAQAEDFSKIWDEALPKMQEGVEIVASGEDAEKRTLTEVLTFRDSKFQRIVEDCFEILADSDALTLVQHADKVRDDIAKTNRKIAELQQKMISAPEDHWNPLKMTKKRIKAHIADLREEIAQMEHSLDAEKEEVFQAINRRGLPIAREQLETMLGAADGKDIASIMAVADNVKVIQKNIETQLAAPDSTVDLVQTYTGIYMMCNKVYVHALERALSQIDDQYSVRLAEIGKEASELLQGARQMMNGASASDRQILKANVSANERTLKAVDLYRQYLQRQKAHLLRLKVRADKSYTVSVNTYRTVKTSTALLGMMRNSEADFSRIFSFQPPDLSLLYDDRLRKEFDTITERLRVAE